MTNTTDPDSPASPSRPAVEVGWLVAENLEAPDREAIKAAHERVTGLLAEHLSEFEWRTPLAVQEAPSTAASHEAVEHLGWAREQRDLRGWDYVLAFVAPDLIARQRDHAWECVSRSLDSAVISTARIDPRAQDPDVSPQYRVETLADRLVTLVLRGLAHLCGVPVGDAAGRVMSAFQAVGELEEAEPLTQAEWDQLRQTLRETADPRLEETATRGVSDLAFYLRAGWRNRHEVFEAVRQARPWQMPLRLARLTIAAVSTMLVLIMTAEAWELGVRQPLSAVAALTGVSLVVTVVYVLVRQGLLLAKRSAGLSEQVVTTNLTTIAIVTTGIATTYVCLYLLTLLVTASLFDAELVASWAPTLHERADWECYATFAGFVSSIGIVIGALGVSFEGQHYFRHITYVDEEV